eukprot:c22129_g1_i1 orf=342-2387(+)
MALVLKIKHNGTLRRWVVLQTLPEKTSDFTLTFNELEGKIRELFHFASNKVLLITYVDKEGDVITLADDEDLLDACVVQGLNPLRLDVQIVEKKRNTRADSVASTNPLVRSTSTCPVDYSSNPVSNTCPHMTPPLAFSFDNGNMEHSPKAPFPQAAADNIKQFVTKYTQGIDPNLHPAVILKNIQKALKDFAKTLVHEGQRLAPRVTPPARSPAFSRCASSEPPVQTPCMDGTRPIVHFGVKCDGCSIYPIQGLRYKSTKVFNYDLCSTCFEKMGNENDYQKMEKPASLACHGFHHPSRSKGWTTPFASGTDGWKSECPFLRIPSGPPADMSKKLDASFVKDISVFDGSELVPGMYFTKLLRLKNVGSVPWPQGTQFVHIGGDKLVVEPAVDLKLPEVPVGLEFDIFVRMRAPDTAGNYISHWCLTAPDGERFGQTVWVAIQVCKENKSSQVQTACTVDEKAESMEEASNIQGKIEPATNSQNDGGLSVSQDKEQKRLSFGNHESVYKADQAISSANVADKSPKSLNSSHLDQDNVDFGSDDVDGFSMIQKPVDTGSFKMMHAPVVSSQTAFLDQPRVIQAQYGRTIGMDITNQGLNLHALEAMGFTNRNLNAILLEKNKQDLQLTLDDLLLGSGWDNLLKDLHEMGFDDTYTNLRLLIKNEGSIKHVVKELVELDKQKEE